MTAPLKLLFVEDEPDIRFVIQLAFKRLPHVELTGFENGVDALEALAGTYNDFDLLMSDVLLPGMTGPEFIEQLRLRPSFEDLPVIFLTGSILQEELEGMDVPNCLGVIAKPFDALTLPEQVLGMINQRQTAG